MCVVVVCESHRTSRALAVQSPHTLHWPPGTFDPRGQVLGLKTPCPHGCMQALSSRDMTTFLLRAPAALFTSCTQAQALKVLVFLKRDLGVKQEYLFPRIVCAAPGVLLQVGHD